MTDKLEQLALKAGINKLAYSIWQTSLEEFARLVITEYENEKNEDRREVKSKLGYSRIGHRNV